MNDPAPLKPQNAAVACVCEAFGWDADVKWGHAASWTKKMRTAKHMELAEFVVEFNRHYGRVDPGAGEWWVYREVYPCSKVAGAMPTPQMVENTWGRWMLATAVQLPARQTSKYADALSFLEKLEAAEHGN